MALRELYYKTKTKKLALFNKISSWKCRQCDILLSTKKHCGWFKGLKDVVQLLNQVPLFRFEVQVVFPSLGHCWVGGVWQRHKWRGTPKSSHPQGLFWSFPFYPNLSGLCHTTENQGNRPKMCVWACTERNVSAHTCWSFLLNIPASTGQESYFGNVRLWITSYPI